MAVWLWTSGWPWTGFQEAFLSHLDTYLLWIYTFTLAVDNMNYYINSFQCFLNLTNFFSIALKFNWQRTPPCLLNIDAGAASVRALGNAGALLCAGCVCWKIQNLFCNWTVWGLLFFPQSIFISSRQHSRLWTLFLSDKRKQCTIKSVTL